MANGLELRRYGLVPYNISPIQQGIQYGHAGDEYSLKLFNHMLETASEFKIPQSVFDDYIDWIKNWKTYIILNGGTTNDSESTPGTMNEHLQELQDNDIFVSEFREPDLGDQLTGIDFIVDERVFKKKTSNGPLVYHDGVVEDALGILHYPDFYDFLILKTGAAPSLSPLETSYPVEYAEWLDYIGGPKNLFLRGFVCRFKLAGT